MCWEFFSQQSIHIIIFRRKELSSSIISVVILFKWEYTVIERIVYERKNIYFPIF